MFGNVSHFLIFDFCDMCHDNVALHSALQDTQCKHRCSLYGTTCTALVSTATGTCSKCYVVVRMSMYMGDGLC